MGHGCGWLFVVVVGCQWWISGFVVRFFFFWCGGGFRYVMVCCEFLCFLFFIFYFFYLGFVAGGGDGFDWGWIYSGGGCGFQSEVDLQWLWVPMW